MVFLPKVVILRFFLQKMSSKKYVKPLYLLNFKLYLNLKQHLHALKLSKIIVILYIQIAESFFYPMNIILILKYHETNVYQVFEIFMILSKTYGSKNKH